MVAYAYARSIDRADQLGGVTMASIKAVADILRMPARVTAHGEALNAETLKDFTEQWKTLPEKDKEELKAGVADGSMNY